MFGSDAQQFLPPAKYARDIQVPAIRTFLVCDDGFASDVYDYGLRWLPLTERSTPESDLQLALKPFGRRGAYWLRDIWSGRELRPNPDELPTGAGPDASAWHESLQSRPDGAPPYRASLLPGTLPELSQTSQVRRQLGSVTNGRLRYLGSELPVFSPRSRAELDRAVAAVAADFSAKSPARLWFRGQSDRHTIPRDPDGRIGEWLGLAGCEREPSLIPSIARPGVLPADRSEAEAFAWSLDFIWRAPLLAWLAEQEGYAPNDPKARQQLDDLTENVSQNIGTVLGLIQFHPELDALDDLRQWWIEGPGRGSVVALWMQHYGAPTRALDITADLDIALYFARRRWSEADGAFHDVPDQSGASIFVFCERATGSGDQYIFDTTELLRTEIEVQPPPRIANQSCGLLLGANAHAFNRALDLAVAKIDLSEFSFEPVAADDAIYPPPGNDRFFARLLKTQPPPPFLARFGH